MFLIKYPALELFTKVTARSIGQHPPMEWADKITYILHNSMDIELEDTMVSIDLGS